MELIGINSVEDAKTLAIASFAVTCGSSHDAARKVRRRRASLSQKKQNQQQTQHMINPTFHCEKKCGHFSSFSPQFLGAHCAGIKRKPGPETHSIQDGGRNCGTQPTSNPTFRESEISVRRGEYSAYYKNLNFISWIDFDLIMFFI